MAPEDIEKTADITPFGLFEYLFMTFGLRNASQSFQRYINRILGDLEFVFIYIDDILVASSSLDEHIEHLRVVFQRLKEFHLRLNVAKCVLGAPELEFLGYIVNGKGIRPTSSRVKSISDFPRPKTISDLRRFLGMVNFYRRNVPHAARAQVPLNSLLVDSHKDDKRIITWSNELIEAFEKTKSLADAAMLVHPHIGAKLRIVSDAFDLAMGAVLEQGERDTWEPLAFFSRKFSPSQTRYSAYDRELTAIFESIKYFRHFIEGREFKIKPITNRLFTHLFNDLKKRPRANCANCYLSPNSRHISNISRALKMSSSTHFLELILSDYLSSSVSASSRNNKRTTSRSN